MGHNRFGVPCSKFLAYRHRFRFSSANPQNTSGTSSAHAGMLKYSMIRAEEKIRPEIKESPNKPGEFGREIQYNRAPF